MMAIQLSEDRISMTERRNQLLKACTLYLIKFGKF